MSVHVQSGSEYVYDISILAGRHHETVFSVIW